VHFKTKYATYADFNFLQASFNKLRRFELKFIKYAGINGF